MKWLVLASLLMSSLAVNAAEPIKVFILAGQSNMEGKAKVALLDYQAKQPETRDLFKHLRKDDKWIERDDVWIKFLERKGKLTVGYGSPNCVGPELGFGTVVGDHFREQVLLIKTAWGGKAFIGLSFAFWDCRTVLEKMLLISGSTQPEPRSTHQKTIRCLIPGDAGRSEWTLST